MNSAPVILAAALLSCQQGPLPANGPQVGPASGSGTASPAATPQAVVLPTHADWLASLPPSTAPAGAGGGASSTNLPQYDQGALGWRGKVGPVDLTWAKLWSWSTGYECVFDVDLSTFPNLAVVRTEEDTDAQQFGKVASDCEAKFSPSYASPNACQPTSTACVAEASWHQVALPPTNGFPVHNPAGSIATIHKIVEVSSAYDAGTGSCSAAPVREDVGWRYRVRAMDINGAAVWSDLWFVDHAKRSLPDKCAGVTTTQYTEEYVAGTVASVGLRDFVAELRDGTAGCTKAWCAACDPGTDCHYINVQLNWKEQK